MSKKRYTPEQIIGKLREAEVALSAIYHRCKSQTKMVDMVLKALALGLTYGGVRGIPGKAVRL